MGYKMTIKQFFDKWNGRYVDADNNASFQCTDVMRQFCVDVLGVNGYTAISPTGWAKYIFRNFTDNKYFTKVLNTPTNAPLEGDIVFWGTYPLVTGLAGHVAICSSADSMNLITFDQNYKTGTPCHFQKHSYRGVMGWLTKK